MPPSLCVNSLKTRVLVALCCGVPAKLYPGRVGMVLFELAHLKTDVVMDFITSEDQFDLEITSAVLPELAG